MLFVINIQSSFGQFLISKPVPVRYSDEIDSLRLRFSNFLIGNSILESKDSIDIRIYRFQAFGDYKVIRIYGKNEHDLKADMYSSLMHTDTLRYHKKFESKLYSRKLHQLINKTGLLNIESFDFEYLIRHQMAQTRDGNMYEIESKVKDKYHYQNFVNPEVYAKYFTKKSAGAVQFSRFIKSLERMMGIKISEIEDSLLKPHSVAQPGIRKPGAVASYVTSYAQTNQIRTEVSRIAEKLGKEEILHLGAAVGEAGVPETSNKYYRLYVRLKNRATNDELYFLTHRSSKIIVLYAFTLLKSRNDGRVKDVYQRYAMDTSDVWQAGGCTGVLWKVNQYMSYTLKQ
jgi:hypothetical protein